MVGATQNVTGQSALHGPADRSVAHPRTCLTKFTDLSENGTVYLPFFHQSTRYARAGLSPAWLRRRFSELLSQPRNMNRLTQTASWIVICSLTKLPYSIPGVDLNRHNLHKVLGAHFNPEFMSVEQPLEMILSPNGTYSSPNRHHIPRDIRRLARKVVSKDSENALLKVSRRIRNKVKRFLMSYTHCPVLHKWKDVGVRFWPRWIKTGSCDTKRSCSIPAGMRCKPMESTKLTLLRYFCRTNWKTKERDCSWIEAQYPVTSACKCRCSWNTCTCRLLYGRGRPCEDGDVRAMDGDVRAMDGDVRVMDGDVRAMEIR
jgi:noggin